MSAITTTPVGMSGVGASAKGGAVGLTQEEVGAIRRDIAQRLSTGKFAANLPYFSEVLGRLVEGATGESAAEVAAALCDVYLFFHQASMPEKALATAQAAERLARSSGDKATLRRSLNVLGAAFLSVGDFTNSTSVFDEALVIARDLGDPVGESAVLANVVANQIHVGLHNEALNTATNVIGLFESHRDRAVLRQLALTAYANVAVAALFIDDPALGDEAVQRGLELIERESSGRQKSALEIASLVLLEYHAVRLFLHRGAVADARAHVNAMRALVAQSGSPRDAIHADFAEGLCEAYEGRHDIALTRLTEALNASKVHAILYPEALRVIAKAYEIAGRPQEALAHLNQLLAHVQQQQSGALKKRLASIANRFTQSKPSEQVTMIEKQQAEMGRAAAEHALWELQREEMERLAIAAELRDDSTGEHSYRVGKLASLLARELNLPREQLRGIELAARLHDIGKISIPDSILLKPGRFNDTERKVMQSHTTIGADLLSQSKNPEMEIAQLVARYHHEWWDGTGYPDGLAGEDIPLVARISALADVFDALTHKRPYKEAIPFEESMAIIGSLRGTQFDPDLTDRFFELMYRLNAAYGDGLEALLAEEASKSAFLKARASINATVAAHSLGRIGALTSLSNTSRLRALSAEASPAPDTKH